MNFYVFIEFLGMGLLVFHLKSEFGFFKGILENLVCLFFKL